MERLNVGPAQYALLKVLRRAKAPLTGTTVIERTLDQFAGTSGGMRGALGRLVSRGMVEVSHPNDNQDARTRLYVITDRGREALERA